MWVFVPVQGGRNITGSLRQGLFILHADSNVLTDTEPKAFLHTLLWSTCSVTGSVYFTFISSLLLFNIWKAYALRITKVKNITNRYNGLTLSQQVHGLET
jgi:hypothetical protein